MVEGLNGAPAICVPFAHNTNCFFFFCFYSLGLAHRADSTVSQQCASPLLGFTQVVHSTCPTQQPRVLGF